MHTHYSSSFYTHNAQGTIQAFTKTIPFFGDWESELSPLSGEAEPYSSSYSEVTQEFSQDTSSDSSLEESDGSFRHNFQILAQDAFTEFYLYCLETDWLDIAKFEVQLSDAGFYIPDEEYGALVSRLYELISEDTIANRAFLNNSEENSRMNKVQYVLWHLYSIV